MNNIEILEKYIKEVWKPTHNVILEWSTIGKEQIEAIENLIQENKELKEKYLLLNQINDIEKSQHRKSIKELLKDINNNYIPKSKLKEKFENMRKKHNNLFDIQTLYKEVLEEEWKYGSNNN